MPALSPLLERGPVVVPDYLSVSAGDCRGLMPGGSHAHGALPAESAPWWPSRDRGLHRAFGARCTVLAYGVWVRRDVVWQDQERCSAGAHEVTRHGVDEVGAQVYMLVRKS